MKRQICCFLALVLLCSLFSGLTYAAEAPAESDSSGQTPVAGTGESVQEPEEPEEPEDPEDPENPEDPEESHNGPFSDVKEGDWYYDHIMTAYELGLVEGREEGLFVPLDRINLAEVITLAVRLRSDYTGDEPDFTEGEIWYTPIVDYALAQGIIQEGDFADYTAQATRAQVAYIFSGALPSGALEEMNIVEDNSLPDVKMGDAYAANIYSLYRAGILSGTDDDGTFCPSDTAVRAEATAIAIRIACPSLRERFEHYAPPPPPEPTYPNLSLRARADDSFFADAAFLGNSLVEGLRLYGRFKTADFYSGTSVSVVSALYTRDFRLSNGAYVTRVAAIAQKQYGKIYIELGVNEIGGSVTTFIKNYRNLLNQIRASQPNADIYILAITPTGRSRIGTVFSKERVIMYNNALYNLAAEWGCYYFDSFNLLADSQGYLPSSQTGDGIHFTGAKYYAWAELIRQYYA